MENTEDILKLIQKDLLDIKHSEEQLKAGQKELILGQEILKANQEVLRVNQEDLKANQEDLKANQEELKANQEELKASQEELKASQEELKIRQERLELRQLRLEGNQEEMREEFTSELRKTNQRLAVFQEEITKKVNILLDADKARQELLEIHDSEISEIKEKQFEHSTRINILEKKVIGA